MDQLIPSLEALLAPFAVAFRQEVFRVFCATVGAWIVCLGRRTISRVWETTGQSETRNHASAFRLFSAAAWNWDEVCAILALAVVAQLVPGMWIWVVLGDCAYVGQHLLRGREANVEVIGPIRWDAALSEPLAPGTAGRRKKGARLPTPAQMLANDRRWPAQDLVIRFPKGKRRLRVKVVKDVCWYHAAGSQTVQWVLIRDPQGEWRDEALLSTDQTLTPQEVITGYCRRWSAEVAFCDSKQMLGFHDPQVWCAKSVARAAPMSWFIGSLVVLWYVIAGHEGEQAQRHRPWYRHKPQPTFADMLGACRLHLWRHWLSEGRGSRADLEAKWAWLLEYLATSA